MSKKKQTDFVIMEYLMRLSDDLVDAQKEVNRLKKDKADSNAVSEMQTRLDKLEKRSEAIECGLHLICLPSDRIRRRMIF
ncbi:MAG TPA: hypothetical protein ENJ77_01210 [Candidatus Moranbacteria bacterium]|nr:hypothetical protein [Candidatus Moranbacteria bacterium]